MGNYLWQRDLRRSSGTTRFGLALMAALIMVLVLSLATGLRSMGL